MNLRQIPRPQLMRLVEKKLAEKMPRYMKRWHIGRTEMLGFWKPERQNEVEYLLMRMADLPGSWKGQHVKRRRPLYVVLRLMIQKKKAAITVTPHLKLTPIILTQLAGGDAPARYLRLARMQANSTILMERRKTVPCPFCHPKTVPLTRIGRRLFKCPHCGAALNLVSQHDTDQLIRGIDDYGASQHPRYEIDHQSSRCDGQQHGASPPVGEG